MTSNRSAAMPLLSAALGLAGLLAAVPARANDFPSAERVFYVQECMQGQTGSNYELVNKCSCALDALAARVPFDDYVEMSTAARATTIGGERGGYIRDAAVLQEKITRYKELQIQVRSGCFLGPPPR
ncbi:MAG: hypothetical protein ABIQ87_02265 [Rubrivivax sp.]